MFRSSLGVFFCACWMAGSFSADAQAGVAGQHFNVNFQSTQEGAYTGVFGFNSTTLYVDNDENGPPDTAGSYTASGTVITGLSSQTSSSDGLYGQLIVAVSIDLKQSSIPAIQVLFAATPAQIVGVGIGTGFDVFFFTGKEDLQTTSTKPSRKK